MSILLIYYPSFLNRKNAEFTSSRRLRSETRGGSLALLDNLTSNANAEFGLELVGECAVGLQTGRGSRVGRQNGRCIDRLCGVQRRLVTANSHVHFPCFLQTNPKASFLGVSFLPLGVLCRAPSSKAESFVGVSWMLAAVEGVSTEGGGDERRGCWASNFNYNATVIFRFGKFRTAISHIKRDSMPNQEREKSMDLFLLPSLDKTALFIWLATARNLQSLVIFQQEVKISKVSQPQF